MKWLLILIFLLAIPHQLLADEISSTFEQSEHRVSIDLKKTIAKIRVERIFKNTSSEEERLEFLFSLPKRAVVSDLKIFENGKWRRAAPIQYSKAQDIYGDHSKNSKAKGSISVLLSKSSRVGGEHALYASPISGKDSFRISYDIEIPFEYKTGTYYFPADAFFTPLPGTKPIVLTTKDRFFFRNSIREPGVVYSIFQNECEKLGVPSHCLIRNIETPFLKSAVFSADYDSKQQSLKYVLVPPSHTKAGKITSLRKPWGRKTKKLRIEEKIGKEVGKWRFVAWNEAKGTGTIRNIKIESDKQVYFSQEGEIVVPEKAGQKASQIQILKRGHQSSKKTMARLGEMKVDGYKYLELNLDIAEDLSELPKDPLLIFIVDTSISQGFLGVTRQLNVAKSISGHLADHDTKVVVYNRNAEESGNLESFSTTFRAKPNRYLRNGSNIETGLKLAAQIEAKTSKRPVLIYAMTDQLMKASSSLPAFLSPLLNLRKETVVHLLNVQESEGDEVIKVQRNDEMKFREFATQHQGVAVEVSIPSVYDSSKDRPVLSTRYLVRPDRLDNLRVPAWNEYNKKKATRLEGERFTLSSGWEKGYKSKIVVAAKLWNQEKTFRVRSSRKSNRRTTLSYAASGQTSALNEVGKKARVLTFYTSFYIPGRAKGKRLESLRKDLGIRSPADNLMSLERGSGLFAVDGKKAFAEVAQKCKTKKKKESAKMMIETTQFEIVAVTTGTTDFSKCIEKEIWKTHLPEATKTGRYEFKFSSDASIK